MGTAQIVATVLAGAVTITAVVLALRAVRTIVSVIRRGQPDPARFAGKAARTRTMLRETLGHTRMLKWSAIGAAHWFVMVSFLILFLLVVEAYFEVADPSAGLPVIGHWIVYGFVTEWIGIFGLAGILYLIFVRQRAIRAPRSRFLGSTMWQAYFVEGVILGVLVCGFLIRGFKVANGTFEFPGWATPLSHAVGSVLPEAGDGPTWVALVKLLISMGWLITIGLNPTMGVAWHRFLAFFNIFFKRSPEKPAGSGLGALRPMMSAGKLLDFEEADPEKDQFGVATIDQFTWKGLLDFATCTECGRCQSQCPAWNTAKPLSPKLMVLSLRDHAFDVLAMAEKAQQPLIGDIIDPDVLWSCTTCGACVEQCPVDIEHVDHIVDMRRYQVLIESSFPAEAGVMLRNLENKGNPWGAPQNTREDWTKGLGFEVPRAGSGADFEYLFWVGCAGAFEDRAKKTTRAVA
ncbi:(Fe-S)-binding protein, partial [Paractinoplanes rhizophilus]